MERGPTEVEVHETIRHGVREPARRGRFLYRMNFQYDAEWHGSVYRIKQVATVVAEQATEIVVVTVYTFYF